MAHRHPDKNLIALGIQQPWAELIVRGLKTVEVRSLNTRQRGTIYIYASKRVSDLPAARDAVKRHNIELERLPRGFLVGTVELVVSRPCDADDAPRACLQRTYLDGQFAWTLANPDRFAEPMAVRFLPYGVWFYPFQRRNGSAQRGT